MSLKRIKYITIFIVGLSLFIGMIKLQNEYYGNLREEYPRINTFDSLNHKVLEIHKEKGICLITVKNRKFRISSSQNYDYKSEYIDNNIFEGDSLVKNSNSDTIYIFSSESIKYFVHQKVINRPE